MTDLDSHDTAIATGPTHAAADPDHADGHHRSVLRRILDWLTAGYPSGVPPTERYALIALLKRTLTDEDVQQSSPDSPPRTPQPWPTA